MQPTQSLLGRLRRLALTTKQASKGYYKGTGSGSMGSHTKYGGYKIDPQKVRTYVVPSGLDKFRLTPFVTRNMEPLKGRFPPGESPLSGKYYVRQWRQKGANL